MNILIALLIGALMGGLNGVGIFFGPREPVVGQYDFHRLFLQFRRR
jgi:hypothetical protein